MNHKTKQLTRTAVLAAVGAILMLIAFPIPFLPPWLKLDFSDVPILLGGFSMGPMAAFAIAAIRNLLSVLMTGASFGGVGDLASLLVSLCLCMPAAVIYRRHKSRNSAALGMAIGAVLMWIVAVIANIYFLAPAAGISTETLSGVMSAAMATFGVQDTMDPLVAYGLLGVVPFNMIRSVLEIVVTLLVYKPLSRLLHD